MAEKTQFLNQLAKNLEYLESRNGDTIVVDGKFIGTGQRQTQNMVKGTTVSKTENEARSQSLFEDSLLGKLEGDLDEDDLEGVIDRYIEKLADGFWEGV